LLLLKTKLLFLSEMSFHRLKLVKLIFVTIDDVNLTIEIGKNLLTWILTIFAFM